MKSIIFFLLLSLSAVVYAESNQNQNSPQEEESASSRMIQKKRDKMKGYGSKHSEEERKNAGHIPEGESKHKTQSQE